MTITDLLERVRGYNPGADLATLQRAYDFSAEVHAGQRRASGEAYVTHPLQVASIIADMRLDVPSIVTGLLHDTVEDTLTTLEQVQQLFGPEIATLVDGVTKIGKISFSSREEKQAENFRKMLLAMARDIRVILVKLADRTHNMRTLGHLSHERQHDVAQETLEIYAPLAHRLGIYWMKSELEDTALRALHPEVYHQLKRSVAKKKAEREKFTKEVLSLLTKKLEEAGLEAEVAGRPKHFYSIYHKMQTQNLLFDQIYDLVAFRVIVDTKSECYEALGVVHNIWKPVPNRFKDYIAIPKPNGYQSLHTTVIGPYGERIEIQIRTREMHRIAEFGIAAHWRYKAAADGGGPDDLQRFAWLRQMLEWQQHVDDPQEFLRAVKEDLFTEQVFVFTPKGDLLDFPVGASVIDFAYRIHSEVGNHCTGARVNGRIVPLRYQLQSGDTVEIVTTAHQTPSKDWLKWVKTSRAKNRIRGYVKAQQSARSTEVGRELVERDFQRHHLDLAKLRKDGTLAKVAKALGQDDEAQLLAAVGYGKIATAQILELILPPEALDKRRERSEGRLQRLMRLVTRQAKPGSGVRVTGVDDVLVRFGKCCSPLPGERIIGFITRGRGVTVHSQECNKVLDTDPQRRIDVQWEEAASVPRPVPIEVTCVDRPGLLAAITKAISSTGTNIASARVSTLPDKKALNTFELMIGNVDELGRVLRNLGRVRGVIKVERVRV